MKISPFLLFYLQIKKKKLRMAREGHKRTEAIAHQDFDFRHPIMHRQ